MTIATYPPAVNGSTASAVLGYAANETTGLDVTTETTIAQVTVYVPAGRTVKVTAYCEPEANAAGED